MLSKNDILTSPPVIGKWEPTPIIMWFYLPEKGLEPEKRVLAQRHRETRTGQLKWIIVPEEEVSP